MKTITNNPILVELNNNEAIIGPEGIPLTAKYIFSKLGNEKEELVNWVYNYYKNKEFVKIKLDDARLKNEYIKLCNKDPDEIINQKGEINNHLTLCNNIFIHFLWDKYYSTKGGPKTKSLYEVFNSDKLLDVIKNRMGAYNKENKRPYIFTITDEVIFQGIQSIGFGYNVSLFNPIVAKYLYKHYAKEKVFDYAAGWGARALASMSLGLEYFGIDPSTSKEINEMIKYFDGKGKVLNGCSEDKFNIPMVDCMMSCPPYFDLEIYSSDDRQSVNKFPHYNDWLEKYWNKTVENCMDVLSNDGYFILIVKDKIDKHLLGNDMRNKCLNNGLILKNELKYKTLASHLLEQKIATKIPKNNETVFIFQKEK